MSNGRPEYNNGSNNSNPGEYPRIVRGMDLEEIERIQHLTENRIRNSTDKVFGSENQKQGIQVDTQVRTTSIITNLEYPTFHDCLLHRESVFADYDVTPQIRQHITHGLNISHPTDECSYYIGELSYFLAREDKPISDTIKQYASTIKSISQLIATMETTAQFFFHHDHEYSEKKYPIVEEMSKNADKDLFATETNLTLSKMVLYYERYLYIYNLTAKAPSDSTQTYENLDKISKQFVRKFKEISINDTSTSAEEKRKIQEILCLMLYVHNNRFTHIYGICDMIDCLDENNQK
jgi:hypothetical protein